MKVIDLLNKIANCKIPKKIKYREIIYHICYEYGDYESDIEEYRFADTKEHYYLFEGIDMLKCLNDEVEIIEEDKKIKKIPYQFNLNYFDSKLDSYTKEEINKTINHIYDKINEIIDYINKGDDKK